MNQILATIFEIGLTFMTRLLADKNIGKKTIEEVFPECGEWRTHTMKPNLQKVLSRLRNLRDDKGERKP